MLHRLPVRVYYEDTDLAGVVYYANYLRYLERGRSEMLRALGIDQRAMREEAGLVFVVRRITADYLAPARFDELVEVRTRITALRGASATMAQEVMRAGTPLLRAEVQVACMDAAGRPRRLPADVRARLGAALEGAARPV